MNNANIERPAVPMSQEEHGVLSELQATIHVLASGQQRTELTLSKFIEATDNRFNALSERGRLSRGDVFAFVGAAITVGAAVAALLSMRIDAALAPVQTQQQVSAVDRQHLHEDVDHIVTSITAGKEARLQAEKETLIRLAVIEDRAGELYFTAHHHYPASIRP